MRGLQETSALCEFAIDKALRSAYGPEWRSDPRLIAAAEARSELGRTLEAQQTLKLILGVWHDELRQVFGIPPSSRAVVDAVRIARNRASHPDPSDPLSVLEAVAAFTNMLMMLEAAASFELLDDDQIGRAHV